ncbi:MAG TPA: endonuclease V [Fibrobacteria bacterium]|nr:endonuclease V [Fibrobacteria bacterium]
MAWFRPPLDPKWEPLLGEWRARQSEMAARVVEEPLRPLPRVIAGADAALSPDKEWVLAAVVIWDREARETVEIAHGAARVEYPYIPGYLGFRESPALIDAFAKIRSPFQAVLFDGMGKAHPRRCGIAVQMGVTLGVPAVGVGKSRLYGTHAEPAPEAGSSEPLWDRKERIGTVLRSKSKVKPLYISVGNKADLDTAVELVRACDGGYRLPEPTRLADREAARFKLEWGAPQPG